MKDKISRRYDVVIVGSGCSGYAAAMYCGRFNVKTLVIGDVDGGVIITTDNVENYPGFKRLTGEELANKLKEHALEYDVDMKQGKVLDIRKKGDCFSIKTDDEKEFEAGAIIVATGTKYRKLGVLGEEKYMNLGVHFCGLCDGPLYKNKIVAVVGGSDSSAKDALVIAQHAKKVYIIYRGEEIHPEPVNMERIKKTKNIEIINNTNVKEIKGGKFVTHVILDKDFRGNKELKLDAVFVAIGHIALSDVVKNLKVKLNEKGEIMINRKSETNVKGIFAAGDVVDTHFKQAITGVGEAVLAAYSAYEYVKDNHICAVDDPEYKHKKK